MPNTTGYELQLVRRSEFGDSIVLYDPYDLEDLPDDVVKAIPEQIHWWEDYLEDEFTKRGLDQ